MLPYPFSELHFICKRFNGVHLIVSHPNCHIHVQLLSAVGADCCSSTAGWPPIDLFKKNSAFCKEGEVAWLPFDTAERVIPAHTSAIACAPWLQHARAS